MTFLFIIGIVVGFVTAIKFSVLTALACMVIWFLMIADHELETFLVWCAPYGGAIIGIIVGWVYYYSAFQPTTGWTIGKTFLWLVTP